MFVSLFIGNPPENVGSQDGFELIEMNNHKSGVKNIISGKTVPIQNINPVKGQEFKISTSTKVSTVKDQATGSDIGVLAASIIRDHRLKITHDTITLHPRFSFVYPDDKEVDQDIDISQIFVNIDTNSFIPVIYQVPEGVTVKDTYHYGKHYYGFILEKMMNINGDVGKPIVIYGYDKRLPETSAMSRFKSISIFMNCRLATAAEELSLPLNTPPDGRQLVCHTVSVECGSITKENKGLFFKTRGLYTRNPKPRFIHLSGPLFATNIIGSVPEKDAIGLIERTRHMNHVPEGYETRYFCIPREDYKSDKEWYDAIINKMIERANNKVRAVALLDNIKVELKDFKRTKLHHLIRIKEDGTAIPLISNR